jgi:biopolymer transport protein ExbD
MSIRQRRHREKFTEPDLTSFMNLMVIMIPSLLINAVFTQVSILNVDQPGDGAPSSAAVAQLPPLTLDIQVYADHMVINNRGHGALGTVTGQDYRQLNLLLRGIKQQYPTVKNATLRIDPTVNYQQIVYVIDAVRVLISDKTGSTYALFPEIQLAALEGSA